MAIFDRMERALSRTVDQTFAMGFELHPQFSTPNGRPIADPQRKKWLGRGILDEAPKYDSIEAGKRDRTGNDLHTIHAGQNIELSVDRHRYPLAAKAKQKDLVWTDDMRGFQIVTIKPDGLSRIVFELVKA